MKRIIKYTTLAIIIGYLLVAVVSAFEKSWVLFWMSGACIVAALLTFSYIYASEARRGYLYGSPKDSPRQS